MDIKIEEVIIKKQKPDIDNHIVLRSGFACGIACENGMACGAGCGHGVGSACGFGCSRG